MISIIVAMGINGEIGKGNKLLFRLPNDMRRFKEITFGKPVIMGRKTFDSIGKPLLGRINIVISSIPGFEAKGCLVAKNLEEALRLAGDVSEIMIIGGGSIYEQFLPLADRIYLTLVYASFDEADTFFPSVDWRNWKAGRSEFYEADEKNEYRHCMTILERKM